MYLVALAFFVASAYSFWVGEVSNARVLLGVAVVLVGARFFLGPLEAVSPLRKVGVGIGILIVIAAVTYVIRTVLG